MFSAAKTPIADAGLRLSQLNSLHDFIPLSNSENSLKLLLQTQKVHAQRFKLGDLNQLPWRYLNCGVFSFARKLFDEISNWDLVSATYVMSAFSRSNFHHDAIHMFSHLLSTDVRPNEFTFSTAIYSGSALCDFNMGKQLHACAMKMGLDSNLFVGSSLLNQYAKLGSIQDARGTFEDIHEPNVVAYTTLIGAYLKNKWICDACYLFERMPERNVVSWNAMIAGCSQYGLNEESIKYFVEMRRQGVPPSTSTFPPVFTAAANITALIMGRSFHGLAIKYLGDKEVDVYVANSLINFYAKCKKLEDSVLVFNRIKSRDTVSWSSIICGYACNGKAKKALQLYKRMRDLGMKPNNHTLHGLLIACNHAGLADEGYWLFRLTKKEQPEIMNSEHYVSLINLFAQAGRFDDATRVLEEEVSFEPGVGIWKALTGGHQIKLNKKMAQFIAKKIKALSETRETNAEGKENRREEQRR
ncbi:hypothetical protein LUZ63_017929 [Rhynchospora breviuscula]|uniref:Pentatricopeptide repeat-containing protein n=1 Tax=Rhynchospora breviuscula TaxID=2022672 RepID=A0A9Q0C3F2_9POAL|nr:hypothetical protein LUZ63_017929 [Rhynchospora breviuscula]